MASQLGSALTAASVTYIVTRRALSATGSSRAPSALAAPRRASQPSTASDRPAATNRKNASAIRCCSTSQTASGTAHSRAKVMMLGTVSRAEDDPVPSWVPSGMFAATRALQAARGL